MEKITVTLLSFVLISSFAFAQYTGGNYDGYAMNKDVVDQSLPVELTSFTACAEKGSVVLHWVTGSEIENLGFILERRTEDIDWEEIATYKDHPELQGQGNITYSTEYAFTDKTVEAGNSYDYRLADVNYSGEKEYHVTIKGVEVSELPKEFALLPAYPNPFNPSTIISFDLPEADEIELFIYDITGREVWSRNAQYDPGYHRIIWNGIDQNGSLVASGIYIYRVKTNSRVEQGKMMLIK